MRVLVSTFGGDDHTRILRAMKSLPYDKLVLIGEPCAHDAEGFNRLASLEEMSGQELDFEPIEAGGFMETVEGVCEILTRVSRIPESGLANPVVLNISGGSKLLGDAALFSAFRLGIPAYHCDERVTKLPVLVGATVVDRFTSSEIKFMTSVRESGMPFDNLVQILQPAARQSVERILRNLRKEKLVETELRSGKIHLELSAEGREVARTLNIADKNSATARNG